MFAIDWLLITLCIVAAYWLRCLVLPPSNFPRNIPTIPFYVVFIPIFTDWDQEKTFKRFFRAKLEKHGAVKVYFASKWNVLVTRPEYVAQVLRNNEVFEKSGNSEKIPFAVTSEYLGDNIISAGNDRWRRYRKVMTNSILFPDHKPLAGHVQGLISVLDTKYGVNNIVSVPDIISRFFLACVGDCVIGCNLDIDMNGESVLSRVKYLKRQIFRPMFMTFPSLDKLRLPSRQRAKGAIKEFKALLRCKILQERTYENSERLGSNLANAYETGEITEKQFEDNAIIALVAGHENPEMLLTTVLYLLAKHPHIQSELRTKLSEADINEKEDVPFLNAVIFESLRMYPPIAQLVNRITRQSVVLGKDIHIPKGVYVGNNSFITQRDQGYWPNADSFMPERWGTTDKEIMKKYTLAKSKCEITAFHGRNRACLGEKFALVEVRKATIAIVEKFEFSLDPNWKERITPTGPIWPVQLSLHMTKLSETKK
ncbi:hypothetical protein OXX69_005817 [Metschnikowia pulcherrima]